MAVSCKPQKLIPFEPVDLHRAGKDLIGDRFTLRRGYPDTLLLGGFTIVVEKYTETAQWNAKLQRFTGLTGYGRVKFSCQTHHFPWNPIWAGALFKPVKVVIVDSVQNAQTQISVRDAKVLGLANKPGETIELQLPVVGAQVVDLGDYLNDLFPNKQPDGIRVAFDDLTVQMSGIRPKTGTVLVGVATYPTLPPIPEPPVRLPVSAGFTLEIDTFTINQVGAIAGARLVLPSSLTAGAECRAATLNLGEILLSKNVNFIRNCPIPATHSAWGAPRCMLRAAVMWPIFPLPKHTGLPANPTPGKASTFLQENRPARLQAWFPTSDTCKRGTPFRTV
jgi:hypothetical protein